MSTAHHTTRAPPDAAAPAGLNGDGTLASDQGPALAAYTADSDVERKLIGVWAREQYPQGIELVPATRSGLTERLRGRDDVLVVPVRVTWLPRRRDGGRRAGLTDVLTLTNPRRPWPSRQKRIARREPDRCPVVVGRPATAGDLRARWKHEAGASGGPAGFAAFVARQATLACDRAERRLIGDRYKVPRLVAEQITASARFREQRRRAGRPARSPARRRARAEITSATCRSSRRSRARWRSTCSAP